MSNSRIPAIASDAHKLYVCRLYKRALKTTQDWYWQRQEFRQKALIIRQLFQNKYSLTNPLEITNAIADAEFLLAIYAHPQPYISPTSPGGTKWERNVPFPEELCKRGVTPLDNFS